ncbi:MAG: hypothetical protein HOW97_03605 [Catenulispora sp.]|nr:hypothetical protein [Catenulispora sp.]NUR61008.1 hypothetical protein [Catenulispora sp.]
MAGDTDVKAAARPLALVVTLLAGLVFAHCAASHSHDHNGLDDLRPAAVVTAAGQAAQWQTPRADDGDSCCHSAAAPAQVRPAAGTGLPIGQTEPVAVAGPEPIVAASGTTPRPASADPPAKARPSLMVWRI